jgi:hypothetical protein
MSSGIDGVRTFACPERRFLDSGVLKGWAELLGLAAALVIVMDMMRLPDAVKAQKCKKVMRCA